MKRNNVEDILNLTPLQEGMLFRYLMDPSGESYLVQLCLSLSGPIDLHFFKEAWNIVACNNPVLRAVFRWEKLDRPVQVILKQVDPDFDFRDIRTATEEMGELIESIRLADRRK